MTRNDPDDETDRSVDECQSNPERASKPLDRPSASSNGGAGDERADESSADCSGCPADERCPNRSPMRLAADDRARMDRRDVAKLLATVGGVAAVGSLAAPLAGLAKTFDAGPEGPIYEEGVPLVDGEGERIAEDRLEYDSRVTVFPQTNPGLSQAPTLLVRFPESDYREETRLQYTVDGYAAYSLVCTHAGCIVSDWNDDEDTMICPCHAGMYDPLEGAVVVGGPPPRPLPQLPITLSADGYIVASGPFPEPIGVAGGGG